MFLASNNASQQCQLTNSLKVSGGKEVEEQINHLRAKQKSCVLLGKYARGLSRIEPKHSSNVVDDSA